MDEARLRALIPIIFLINLNALFVVEMDEARLRALIHQKSPTGIEVFHEVEME